MLLKIFFAWCLVALTVIIHVFGMAVILRPALRASAKLEPGFWPVSGLLIRIAWWLTIIHFAEISVWAFFFWWQDCLPDAESSFYFSGVTYSTIGYGDLVLPIGWRLFGPIEGMVGILMCGLSTGFFFALVNRIRPALRTPTGMPTDEAFD